MASITSYSRWHCKLCKMLCEKLQKMCEIPQKSPEVLENPSPLITGIQTPGKLKDSTFQSLARGMQQRSRSRRAYPHYEAGCPSRRAPRRGAPGSGLGVDNVVFALALQIVQMLCEKLQKMCEIPQKSPEVLANTSPLSRGHQTPGKA
jgi:hypothetical protein